MREVWELGAIKRKRKGWCSKNCELKVFFVEKTKGGEEIGKALPLRHGANEKYFEWMVWGFMCRKR
tara:strand:+ start:30 stop:227 length:198 start_codon:yes stop_codon:yes gene_type:complete